jgi:hypothetical protein
LFANANFIDRIGILDIQKRISGYLVKSRNRCWSLALGAGWAGSPIRAV